MATEENDLSPHNHAGHQESKTRYIPKYRALDVNEMIDEHFEERELH